MSVTMYLGKLRDAWYNDEWEWSYYSFKKWKRWFYGKYRIAWEYYFRWKRLMRKFIAYRYYKFRREWKKRFKAYKKYYVPYKRNYVVIFPILKHFKLKRRTYRFLNYHNVKKLVLTHMKYNIRFRKFFKD